MSDYIIRATAADAGIRAFAATTKELVEKARQIHDTSPVITAALGRLLTGGVMMGTMLKGEDDLLTLQVSGDAAKECCRKAGRRRCSRKGNTACDQGHGTEGALCGADRPADR